MGITDFTGFGDISPDFKANKTPAQRAARLGVLATSARVAGAKRHPRSVAFGVSGEALFRRPLGP